MKKIAIIILAFFLMGCKVNKKGNNNSLNINESISSITIYKEYQNTIYLDKYDKIVISDKKTIKSIINELNQINLSIASDINDIRSSNLYRLEFNDKVICINQNEIIYTINEENSYYNYSKLNISNLISIDFKLNQELKTYLLCDIIKEESFTAKSLKTKKEGSFKTSLVQNGYFVEVAKYNINDDIIFQLTFSDFVINVYSNYYISFENNNLKGRYEIKGIEWEFLDDLNSSWLPWV